MSLFFCEADVELQQIGKANFEKGLQNVVMLFRRSANF